MLTEKEKETILNDFCLSVLGMTEKQYRQIKAEYKQKHRFSEAAERFMDYIFNTLTKQRSEYQQQERKSAEKGVTKRDTIKK